MTTAALLSEIEQLTRDERLMLLEEIWDSINEQDIVELTAAQKSELDRRLAAREANPDAGASWEDVKARILSKDR